MRLTNYDLVTKSPQGVTNGQPKKILTMTSSKTILRALAGETLPTPPIWMMRQTDRYLPEYKATRA